MEKLYILAGGFFLVSIITIIILKSYSVKADVYQDFLVIKEALADYKKSNDGFTMGIRNLREYLPEDYDLNTSIYAISLDDKYLIVKKIPSNADVEEILQKVGGNSVLRDKQLKLKFFDMPDEEPVARITILPVNGITTVTKVSYSSKESNVSGEIISEEWTNRQDYFETPGKYRIGLRVLDKYERWSEWVFKEIKVSDVKGFKSLEGGGSTVIRIRENGSIDACGNNSYSQLGIEESKNIPFMPINGIKLISSVSISNDFILYINGEGKVYASGKNNSGQLGVGDKNDYSSLKEVWGIENASNIVSNDDTSMCVISSGDVYIWGYNMIDVNKNDGVTIFEQPKKVSELSGIKKIALGVNHGLAMTFDGRVFGWGENKKGQLGLGFKSKTIEISNLNLSGVTDISAGRDFSIFVINGSVYSCGENKKGQLGRNANNKEATPNKIGELENIIKVKSSNNFSIALDKFGEIYTWGAYNISDSGDLLNVKKCEELENIVDIACTNSKGYAMDSIGSVYEFDSQFNGLKTVIEEKVIEKENLKNT